MGERRCLSLEEFKKLFMKTKADKAELKDVAQEPAAEEETCVTIEKEPRKKKKKK
jgi:hypothetical protein